MFEGRVWLLGLQNRDGGVPTFCRGWTNLPFDRSGADLTAHAVRAMIRAITVRAEFVIGSLNFLSKQQRTDGSWLPLWFGNQHVTDDENPTYGTARVLAAYRDLFQIVDTNPEWAKEFRAVMADPVRRGVAWLLSAQNDDGGWGGGIKTSPSVEETALAVEVLLGWPEARAAAEKGVDWLVERVESGRFVVPSPIGFYFAKLWYHEKLYPLIFTVAALGRAVATSGRD